MKFGLFFYFTSEEKYFDYKPLFIYEKAPFQGTAAIKIWVNVHHLVQSLYYEIYST